METFSESSDTKWPDPQLENGYTRIANELLEAFARTSLSAYQGRVLWGIIRLTYGYQQKTARVRNKDLAPLTGLHKSHVSRAIGELVKRNIITPIGNEITLNKNYQTWQGLPARSHEKVTPIGNDKKLPRLVTHVTPIGNEMLPRLVTESPGNTVQESVSRPLKKERKYKRNNVYSSDFLEFYNTYPVHQAKFAAWAVWQFEVERKGLLGHVMAAIEKQKSYKEALAVANKFCPEWPLPNTWLRQRRWEDEVPDAPSKMQGGSEFL